jgi:hypothetical protein
MFEDSVPRLARFRQEHPEYRINPPIEGDPYWEAFKDGEFVTRAYWLGKLIDKLEAQMDSDESRCLPEH